MYRNLAQHVYRHAQEGTAGQRPALVAEGQTLSYADLSERAGRLAASLVQYVPALKRTGSVRPLVGVLASRSVHACIGVLGCAWAGATYVPIGIKTPPERLKQILDLVGLSAIVTDDEGAKLLSPEILPHLQPSLLIVPQPTAAMVNMSRALDKRVLDLNDLPRMEPPPLAHIQAEDLAYVMFTSGTTGVPKGVMISVESVHAFIEMIGPRLSLTPHDRTLEVTELGFDVSVLNMFATWQAGGSLHVLPATRVMNAVSIARQQQLSVWSSTPSLVSLLRRIKVLKPGALPDLRLAIFIGEPLSQSTLAFWREAAPNCVVEDLYGPTEATVVCTGQRVEIEGNCVLTPERDVLSIGTPLPGTEVAIVDASRNFLPDGQVGELALSGVQLARGYLGAPELTQAKFPFIGGRQWYLTGDSAFRDANGLLHHLGRIDNQVKILGNRVELEEVEAHLRDITRVDLVAVLPWPTLDGVHQGLTAFLCTSAPVSSESVVSELKRRVPAYMVPGQLHWIEHMPVNASGKIDRHALRARLQPSAAV